MSLAIRDASLTTARRRQLAIFSWRQADQYSANPQTWKSEQAPSHGYRGDGPSSDVQLAAVVGAALVGQSSQPSNNSCACSTKVTLQGFVKQSPGC